jgi:TIR domain-containing protein
MMRVLADESDTQLKNIPVFAMVVQQLLFVLGIAADLQSHDVSRACIMDYCDNMSDIKLGLKVGPKFCPKCEKILRAHKYNHLSQLSAAALEFLSPKKDREVAKRMESRGERDADLSLFRYQVALSFAGEDREKAEALAGALKKLGVKVFYDAFEKEALWGVDLYSYLSELYRFKAKYCVMFISRDYAKKIWTNHERKAAQARAFEDNRIYILPIRIDDTEVPGILPTVGYLRWEDENPESIANLIAEKLQAGNN